MRLVFQMQQVDAAGHFLQDFHRIVSRDAYPEAVKFEPDQVLVESVQQDLEPRGSVHRLEFESVIVIAEGETRGTAFFARFVQLVC